MISWVFRRRLFGLRAFQFDMPESYETPQTSLDSGGMEEPLLCRDLNPAVKTSRTARGTAAVAGARRATGARVRCRA